MSCWKRTVFYGALPLRYEGLFPATCVDQVPQGWIPCALPLCYTGLHLFMFNVASAMTISFCKADEEFIHPTNFWSCNTWFIWTENLHRSSQDSNTWHNTMYLCSNYILPLGHSPLCNHCLKWMCPNPYIKTPVNFSIKRNVNMYEVSI